MSIFDRQKTIYIKANEDKGRKYLINKDDLTEEQINFLKEFTEYIIKKKKDPEVIVSVKSTDTYNIINRFNIYILTDKHLIKISNAYNSAMGSDRIFDWLYNFEYLLEEISGIKFNHYTTYSLSNKYYIL